MHPIQLNDEDNAARWSETPESQNGELDRWNNIVTHSHDGEHSVMIRGTPSGFGGLLNRNDGGEDISLEAAGAQNSEEYSVLASIQDGEQNPRNVHFDDESGNGYFRNLYKQMVTEPINALIVVTIVIAIIMFLLKQNNK